jgi:hypothetical protein
MNADCRRARESLAAGEQAEPGHLERCPGCASFARDLERLRVAAAGLPRSPHPAGPRRRARPASRGPRALLALATAASIALAAGLVLRDRALTVPPSSGRDARVPAAGVEERLDLLATLAEARQVYSPSRSAQWLSTEIDPLANLQAAALLIEQKPTNSNSRRK